MPVRSPHVRPEAVGYGVAVYRLFSDFPPGLPGFGLLFLRLALAVFLASEAASPSAMTSSPGPAPGIYSIGLMVLGLLVAVGFLTPIVQAIVIVVESTAVVTELPASGATLLAVTEGRWPLLAMVVVLALALALIGPGAYSIDSHLFGRREILHPRAGSGVRKRFSSTRK